MPSGRLIKGAPSGQPYGPEDIAQYRRELASRPAAVPSENCPVGVIGERKREGTEAIAAFAMARDTSSAPLAPARPRSLDQRLEALGIRPRRRY